MQMSEADRKELALHIREHLNYPATKAQLVEACNYMAHVPGATRQWFSDTLADGTYKSAEDVLHAVDLPHSD